MNSRILTPDDEVVLSAECIAAADPHEVTACNASVVRALLAQLLYPSEIARDALASYHVAGYLEEVENGGLSQFVYNSEWNPEVVAFVGAGLEAMGATRHRALFAKLERLVVAKPSRLRTFLEGWYFGADRERDRFNGVTTQFHAVNANENLSKLNADWLQSRPNLRIVPLAQLQGEIQTRAHAIADREARLARAIANEPRHLKLVRALCATAGQTLKGLTGFDPFNEHEGATSPAWHFLTDRGHHLMIERGSEALMFDGGTGQQVAAVPVHTVGTT